MSVFVPITFLFAVFALGDAQTCAPERICATGDVDCVDQVGVGSTCAGLDLANGVLGCCTEATAVTTTAATITTRNCVDRLNPVTGVSDCPGRAYLCSNTIYRDLMTQQCPLTCGRCTGNSTSTSNSTCVDRTNPQTGVSDCPSRAYLCNNSAYSSLMTAQCPRTCGRCSSTSSSGTGSTGSSTGTSSTCVDLKNPATGVSDCGSRSSLCTNAMYSSLMKVQCPVTCGFCTGK